MSTQPGAGLLSNTLTNNQPTTKPALDVVRRWNDGVNRHTLFTACGTQQDGWGIYNDPGTTQGRAALLSLVNNILRAGGASDEDLFTQLPADGTDAADLGLASPDAVVGSRVNKNLWNWVPVSYPASFPGAPANLDNKWQPQNISFADSVAAGTAEMISLIKATPGTFALCGMSQGAMVISNVLKAMQPGGQLASRAKDCIAGVAYGNPMRKSGSSMPGVAAASGAGMFSPANSVAAMSGLANVTLPPWWWEMCTPGDFFSTAPATAVNGAAGTILTKIAAPFIAAKNTGGSSNPLSFITQLVAGLLSGVGTIFNAARSQSNATALRTIGLWLRDLGFLSALTGNAGLKKLVKGLLRMTDADLADNLLAANPAYYGLNPHVFYGVWKPPSLPTGLSGVNTNSNYIDIGVAYLNQIGNAVPPRGNRVRTS